MSTIQIGSKLVRTFASRLGIRRAITETIGNKTFTQVLDNNGKLLSKRVKEITRQKIGEKSVVTRRVNEKGYLDSFDYQRDLVYDKKGNFLGMRLMSAFFHGKPENVLKVNSDYVGRLKYTPICVDGNITSKSWYGKLLRGRRTKDASIDSHWHVFDGEPVKTSHNYNGIPVPNNLSDNMLSIKYRRGSVPLREMVGKDKNAFSQGSGYEHLNYSL